MSLPPASTAPRTLASDPPRSDLPPSDPPPSDPPSPEQARRKPRLKHPKAASAQACQTLEQLPNIGPSLAADLRTIGIAHPQQLQGQDPWHLYSALCKATGKRHDPCVLDTFMAATDFMQGAAPAPWWHYTEQRKARYSAALRAAVWTTPSQA